VFVILGRSPRESLKGIGNSGHKGNRELRAIALQVIEVYGETRP
jgi:hypothetical protein